MSKSQRTPLLPSSRWGALFPFINHLNAKIPHRILIADIPHNPNQRVHVSRVPALLHHLTKHPAEDAAEILMPRVG